MAAIRVEGRPVGAPSRAVSYPANVWEYFVREVDGNYTYYVPVTGEIDDKEHKYWLRPGAFCEVEIPVGDARQAIVVPTLAVQPTENGNTVYVVQGNQAKARAVALGMHTADGSVEVTRGLVLGDRLVVRGIDLLSDGAPVKITSPAPADSAGPPEETKPEEPKAGTSVAVANDAPPAAAHTGGKHHPAGGAP